MSNCSAPKSDDLDKVCGWSASCADHRTHFVACSLSEQHLPQPRPAAVFEDSSCTRQCRRMQFLGLKGLTRVINTDRLIPKIRCGAWTTLTRVRVRWSRIQLLMIGCSAS